MKIRPVKAACGDVQTGEHNEANSRFSKYFARPPKILKLKEKRVLFAPNFSVREWKGNWDKGVGRILLGDNTGGGAVMLPPIMFCWDGVWVSSGLPCIRVYTRCNKRNGPDFGRAFLMLNYTEKPQNTSIQSWTAWEIMEIENCGLPSGPRTIAVSWHSYLLVGLLAELQQAGVLRHHTTFQYDV